jgi:CheY-like chemotaxis protein
VGDLLDFGQGFPGERLPTDLNTLVRSAVQPMFPASQNQRITWGLTTEPVLVECVPHQLAQVFVSLLENALRAAKTQVAFNVVPKPGRVLLRISDDGPGVPKELRARIFQPFFTTYKEEGCLGLGLSLSQSVVDEYGGKIVLETPSGRGACFVVQLPLASSEGQAEVTIESVKKPTSTGKRILVVDDEVDLLDMLTIVLEQRGYAVDATGTAARAIDLVQKTTYDAVVLDVQLPGELSGPQFYAHLSQTCPGLARKTMFITADTMNYETRRFLDEVQRPSMEKPFLVSEFLARVTELMQE